MLEYKIKQPFKTKFLNLFRKPLTQPLLEKILVNLTLKKPSSIFKKFIPPDYLYKKESFRLVRRNGISLKLDLSNVVDHYIYFGYRDADYGSIIEKILGSKTILDIGANIGTTSLYFASLNQSAQIFGFEPHPITFKRAVENVALNLFSNIELINIGLGEKKQILKLYEVNEHNPGMNRIISENVNLPFKNIIIDSLDNVCLTRNIEHVDLIKLDVEGFEYSVLKGAKDVIANSKPLLFIELDNNNLIQNNSSAKSLINLLNSYGYLNIYRADTSQTITPDSCFIDCHFDIIAN